MAQLFIAFSKRCQLGSRPGSCKVEASLSPHRESDYHTVSPVLFSGDFAGFPNN